MDKQKTIDNIARENGVALMYIFGSQVKAAMEILQGARRERVDPLADIDVGVVFRDGLPGPRGRIDLYSSIHNALQDVFAPYPVDLVLLQETHSVFQGNAICGQCVYSLDAGFRSEYEENVLRRAADFRPFLERYLDEVLEGV